MKKKTYIKLMTATVLASTILLGACGNKKETTQVSSSAKTSQSSSSKAASASKESKTQKFSSSASSEQAKASTDQSSASAAPSQVAPEQRQGQEVSNQQAASQQTPAQAPQAQSNQSSYDSTTDRKLQDKQAEQNKRYKGVLTMVDGDFSAAAGNWKGENGETITVSSGGQFTVESADGKKENYSIKGYSYTLDDGKYNAKIGGGKIIQITTGADGKVSSVALSQ
ncbi:MULTISPECIES: hypothetical protein [Streptococcus]|uniref:Lipoprotein n=1 Tax=Streptococcus shenyangsis TaxID=2589786 RepID=A0ABY2YKM2_9STRE|nr:MULTISPECIES: hypothetical protein [Streptococcus]MDU4515021.1 hypothetical protein [Streptococcus mitis]TPE39544.1 hypothetical protein FJR73_06320 [Streptococcus sp. D2]TPE42016.1 hypothetical protein FJR77_01215 [Streptococcus shenyangsis]